MSASKARKKLHECVQAQNEAADCLLLVESTRGAKDAAPPTTPVFHCSACYLNSPNEAQLVTDCGLPNGVGRQAAERPCSWSGRTPGRRPIALHGGPARLEFIGVMQPEEHVCSADSLPSKIYRSSRRAPRFRTDLLWRGTRLNCNWFWFFSRR